MLLAAEYSPWFVRGLAFVFGAIWGSFFNVAIYRWPREMSVITPPSHCPSCGAKVRAWHNVPIVGYLALGGKAACCGAKLSSRYLWIELLSAVLCVAVSERFIVHADETATIGSAALEAMIYFLFVGGLVIATFVDLESMQIPDEVSLPGAALGLATVAWRAAPGADAAALGAGLGFLIVQVPFVWGYEALLGRRGMGEGDSKLLMMIGAFVGWKGVVFSLFAGALQGLVAAGILVLMGRKLRPETPDASGPEDNAIEEGGVVEQSLQPTSQPPMHEAEGFGRMKMPFGPFLALGALEFLFFAEGWLDAYVALLRG